MSEHEVIRFNRAQQLLLTLAAFVIVIAGMKAAQDILVPFLLSLFIAIIVTPLLNWLRGRGLPAWLAILLILLIILTLGFLLVVMVGSSLTDFSAAIPEYQQGLQAKTLQLFNFFTGLFSIYGELLHK